LILRSLFYPMLALGLMLFGASAQAESNDDPFLQQIYENGEVVVCKDEEALESLLSGDPLASLALVCWNELVQSKPDYLGWAFVGPIDFSASVELFADGSFLDSPQMLGGETTENVVVRKYEMETQHGPVLFVWPYPLDEADFVAFGRTFDGEEEPALHDEEEPEIDIEEEPSTVLPSTAIVKWYI